MEEQKSLLKAVMEAVTDVFAGVDKVKEELAQVECEKSFMQKSMDDELMQATFIVLEPDVVDLHGDTYSAEEVRKACHNFNTFCRKAYLDHREETDKIDFVESYIVPDDVIINDFAVKKGTWLAVAQFKDEELWKQAKDDDMVGVSIGAYCKVETLNE